MSRGRLEECERNSRFMLSEARLKIFLKKYKIRALKFIVLLLNCTLGPPNLGVGGGSGPQAPPGSASAHSGCSLNQVVFSCYQQTIILLQ